MIVHIEKKQLWWYHDYICIHIIIMTILLWNMSRIWISVRI